jgi:external thioesterase TEII
LEEERLEMDRATRILKRGAFPRLVCLPYAGGASSAFLPLARQLPKGWEVLAIDPPGHGATGGELLEEFQDLVAFYERVVPQHLEPAGILFGHSLGGLAAFRLTLLLERQGRSPSLLIVSATPPPHLVGRRERYWYEMSDEEIKDELRQMGGIAEELLNEAEYMEYILPIIRADSRLVASFRHEDSKPISTPLIVLGGDADLELPAKDLDGWRVYSAHARIRVVRGPHMFLHTSCEEMASRIREEVEWTLEAG